MRALAISPQPFFTPRGTPFSVYYRTLVMAELGVDIDLLTYGQGADVEIPGVRIIRIPSFRMLGKVKIGPSLLKLFLDFFLFFWTIMLLARQRYDFVHAHEEAVFFCRLLKPLFGFKLVYDMHSSLPQQLKNFQFSRSRILITLFKKLEESCLRFADVVITVCPSLEDYVTRIVPKNIKHILIENTIFDPVRIVLKTVEVSAREAQENIDEKIFELIRGKRLLVYAGTLELYQGIETLIKAFSHVKMKASDTLLVIVGGTDSQVSKYSALAKQLGIQEHCVFTGRRPHLIAKRYTRLASVLLSPRSEGTNTPLKIYEQLASGVPLVATNIHSHTQVLNNNVAFLVKPEPNDMADGILKALNMIEDRCNVAVNAKKLYDRNYSRPVYEEKVRQVLELLA